MGDKKKVQYQLKVSKRRKTIAIRVEQNGDITIYAPIWAKKRTIDGIVEKKRPWIQKQRENMLNIYRQAIYRAYNENECFLVFGKNFLLKIDYTRKRQTILDEKHKQILIGYSVPKDRRKQRVREIYRYIGKRYVQNRMPQLLDRIEHITGTRKQPKRIILRHMKRRWGGCSSSGTISISLRLFGAPVELIDYVLIHELVHLYQMNHQNTFYSLLQAMEPEWKTRKNRLEELSGALVL